MYIFYDYILICWHTHVDLCMSADENAMCFHIQTFINEQTEFRTEGAVLAF